MTEKTIIPVIKETKKGINFFIKSLEGIIDNYI